NLSRILRLLTVVAVLLIALSVLFANWYTAAVSFGLLSLILGFALQTPTTSLLGWIYILVRAPYRVGDRIRIGNATGDVIDVSYLDTTLWEFGGEFLSTDHPSGRVIKFPNSGVLIQPREAGRVKTRLIKKMLERLNAEPDRVGFPKDNAR